MNGCRTCLYSKDNGRYCTLFDRKLFQFQPKCVRYEDRAEALRSSVIKYEAKLDRLLTLMINCASAAQLFLEDFDRRVDYLDQEKIWRHEKKKALKEIREHGESMRKIYYSFIQPDINKALKGEDGKFSKEMYKNNQLDVNEICRLLMLYSCKCYQDSDNVTKLFKTLQDMKGVDTFEDKDYLKYMLKVKVEEK